MYLVRHSQASLHGNDYDQLSSRGVEQSRLLGLHWAELDLIFDKVYFGPRRRHRQTMEAVAAVYRERRLKWPEPVELPELDEHCGQQVLNRSLSDLMQRDPSIREIKENRDAPTQQREYLLFFQKVTRLWVRRELTHSDLEAWHEFRSRVQRGLAKITEAAGSKKKIAVFTSGGPVAAALGVALNLEDEKTLELSWVVRNAAYTEFLFSGGRFSLVTFNAVPHLTSSDLRTFI
jgi:broad specificity phosphatase PhoE